MRSSGHNKRGCGLLTTHFCRFLLQLQWSSGQNGKFLNCPPTSRWKWDITWAIEERCQENSLSFRIFNWQWWIPRWICVHKWNCICYSSALSYLLIICLLLHFQPKDIKTHTCLSSPLPVKPWRRLQTGCGWRNVFFTMFALGIARQCAACRALCTKFRNSHFHARCSTFPHFHSSTLHALDFQTR